ncbi:hypothetical protein BUALT_Bualt18G0062900 [Buddleja alternifolia]|uniref:non-specific serine/threonine protein kinase n=1 Tax=Buddleja alternifolia TaxID=168488 RepID=A0AAV6W932_9LAMI|nr:hypothetical protein BUALT_Bualt18G0062900 [Buddleja alternifolia]
MSFPQFTLLLYAIIHALTFLKFSLGADTLFPDQKIVNGQTLISQNQIFEMGFFSPGTSIKGFLGIWYKSTPGVVVWVANRNNPMPDSQGVLLSIARNGTLVISRDGGIIWSLNSSGSASHPILQLLDTGNLVVMDNANKSSYIWQSFDYPTDTRLPGMKMVDDPATGEEKYLTSWRSPDDPSPGDFVYKIENQGLAEMVILRVGIKRYRTGPWNGLYMSGAALRNQPFFKSNSVFKKDILTYILEPYSSSNIYRTTMEQSGFVRRYRMNERRDDWNIVLTLPFDPCDYYAQCGPYGVCSSEKEPMCECLKGFAKGGQRHWDWSKGCTRSMPLNCEDGDGFLEVKAVKFPDLLKFWLNTSMSLSECRGECLKNCNCTAYANPYLTNGGSGCLMWFGDLIDIREIRGVDSRQIMYIRLPVSELESDNNLGEGKKKKKPGKLIIILAAAGVLVSCLICLVMLNCQRRSMAYGANDTACVPWFVAQRLRMAPAFKPTPWRAFCMAVMERKQGYGVNGRMPVMSSVLFMLASEGAVLPEPKEPGFFMETSSSSNVEDYVDISTSKESKKSSMTITDLELR